MRARVCGGWDGNVYESPALESVTRKYIVNIDVLELGRSSCLSAKKSAWQSALQNTVRSCCCRYRPLAYTHSLLPPPPHFVGCHTFCSNAHIRCSTAMKDNLIEINPQWLLKCGFSELIIPIGLSEILKVKFWKWERRANLVSRWNQNFIATTLNLKKRASVVPPFPPCLGRARKYAIVANPRW